MAGTVTYYINGTKQAAPTAVAGPPLVISGISVPAGGNTVIAYEAEVNRYAPLDLESNITNTAVISGNGITPISVNETVNARVLQTDTVENTLRGLRDARRRIAETLGRCQTLHADAAKLGTGQKISPYSWPKPKGAGCGRDRVFAAQHRKRFTLKSAITTRPPQH